MKNMKLRKGMTKYEVNELTKDYILLEDEIYLGIKISITGDVYVVAL